MAVIMPEMPAPIQMTLMGLRLSTERGSTISLSRNPEQHGDLRKSCVKMPSLPGGLRF
jgi:hypothetical protein